MGDGWTVLLAVATAVGAWRANALPGWLPFAVALAIVGWRRRWPVTICLAGALAGGGLSARAWAGLVPPPSGPVSATVTILTDPQPVGSGVSAVVRLSGLHVEALAFGAAAHRLAPRLAGERVTVTGVVSPVPESRRALEAPRHVAARLQVTSVGTWQPGDPASRAANQVRRTLSHGAEVLPTVSRSLFLGFVLGDDRAEPRQVVAEFRATGLGHLTAVSGENVAFFLAVANPLVRRLRLGGRWAATVALLGWFALLTRFEPSVLRACAMAGLAATASLLARPQQPIRLLALAVTALLLVDPLLVWSAGWWLSVAATTGIAVLTRPIEARLPGPRWLALPAAVTIAAQAGVAPVELVVFGSVPLASIPANLLAAPAAGPVMVWGLPAGLVAGLLPPWAAALLHLPTRLLVGWIAGVAHVLAGSRLARGSPALGISLAVAGALVLAAGRWGRRHLDRRRVRARLPHAVKRWRGRAAAALAR